MMNRGSSRAWTRGVRFPRGSARPGCARRRRRWNRAGAAVISGGRWCSAPVFWIRDAGETPQERRLALISDLQDGASLEALGNFAWPQSVNTTLFVIQPRTTDNLSLSTAARIGEEAAEAPAPGSAADPAKGLRVRVMNARGSRVEKFSIAWKDNPARKIEGSVVAGGSRVLPAPEREAGTGGVLELTGDSIAFDNRVFHARAATRVVRILFVSEVAFAFRCGVALVLFLARAETGRRHRAGDR